MGESIKKKTGRPRIKDKKNIGFTVYARPSQVKEHGGRSSLKTKLETVIESHSVNISQI